MRMGFILQDAMCILNQRPLYGAVSPAGRIHGSRNQRVEAGGAYFTITLSELSRRLGFQTSQLGALQG